MKVTATGVTVETGMKMFEIWRDHLKNEVKAGSGVDVRFVLENENGRT